MVRLSMILRKGRHIDEAEAEAVRSSSASLLIGSWLHKAGVHLVTQVCQEPEADTAFAGHPESWARQAHLVAEALGERLLFAGGAGTCVMCLL